MVELPHTDVPEATPEEGRSGYSMWVEEGFSGWAWFAGGLLTLVGLFQMMTGTVALAGSGYYTVPSRNLVIDASYATWGWVHLILGIVLVIAGGGVALGSTVARVVSVVLVGLSAVVNLGFLPAAPVAATLIIGLDVLLIYAITVHGGEPRRPR
jgi:hypothetical protein